MLWLQFSSDRNKFEHLWQLILVQFYCLIRFRFIRHFDENHPSTFGLVRKPPGTLFKTLWFSINFFEYYSVFKRWYVCTSLEMKNKCLLQLLYYYFFRSEYCILCYCLFFFCSFRLFVVGVKTLAYCWRTCCLLNVFLFYCVVRLFLIDVCSTSTCLFLSFVCRKQVVVSLAHKGRHTSRDSNFVIKRNIQRLIYGL